MLTSVSAACRKYLLSSTVGDVANEDTWSDTGDIEVVDWSHLLGSWIGPWLKTIVVGFNGALGNCSAGI